MNRYLIYFSYIGTNYKGVQRQVTYTKSVREDLETIQGSVERALRNLTPINDISGILSSRTDAGVHALENTLHVDLEQKNGLPYNPKLITNRLNKYFVKNNQPIRLLRTFLVPNDFYARHALSRTYLYRLAVSDKFKGSSLLQHIPIEELYRVHFLSASKFDLDVLKQACELFHGLHDFRTFMYKSTQKPDLVTRRVISRLDFEEVPQSTYTQFSWPTGKDLDYKYYNFYIQSSGFLYKQVRRIIATLIGVAQGIITLKDVECMLQIPSHNSWAPQLTTVPPHGLYLCQVLYSKEVIARFKQQVW